MGFVSIKNNKTIFSKNRSSLGPSFDRDGIIRYVDAANPKSWTGETRERAFISVWRTTGFSESITLPYVPLYSQYSGIIDWGDGTQVENTYNNRSHVYASPGDYEVKIYGVISGWTFNYAGNQVNRDNIISIKRWGPLKLGRVYNSNFLWCINLTLSGVTDVLDLTDRTNTFRLFQLCYSLSTIPRVNEWDVSQMNNMQEMFRYTAFNEYIGNWNVSNCLSFRGMLGDCPFNQDISTWNVSKGQLFNEMFWFGSTFNRNIDNWNMSAATNTSAMFRQNLYFNQPINSWNVTKVTNMSYMFYFALVFNKPLNTWNTSGVTNMSYMFAGAYQFNQDLSSWDVSKVTNMSYMFSNNSIFNQNIGNWNITGVTNFTGFMDTATENSFSPQNLDAIYNGWSSKNVKTGITISFGTAKFSSSGLAGKQILTGSPYNWVITDGGMIAGAPPTPTPSPIPSTPTPTPTPIPTQTPYVPVNTWVDLINTSGNTTLFNGPIYEKVDLGGISFDGTDDYLSIPYFNLETQPFVVDIWYEPYQNTEYLRGILSCGDIWGTSPGWSLGYGANSNNDIIYGVVTNNLVLYRSSQIISIPTGQTYNLCLVRNTNTETLSLFKDGVQVDSIYVPYTASLSGNRTEITHKVWQYGPIGPYGRFYSIKIYNDVNFTTDNVLKNYNTFKARFKI